MLASSFFYTKLLFNSRQCINFDFIKARDVSNPYSKSAYSDIHESFTNKSVWYELTFWIFNSTLFSVGEIIF